MSELFNFSDSEIFLHHSLDENPDDSSFPIHFHDKFEILCILSGDVGYMVEGSVYKPTPGSVMIMQSSESHKLMVNGRSPYERYALHFSRKLIDCQGLSNLLKPFTERQLGVGNLYLPIEFSDILPSAFFSAICHRENDETPAARKAVIIAYLTALLSEIYAAYNKKNNETIEVSSGVGLDLIGYINTHLSERLTVEHLSATFHISGSQLSRIFKKSTGTGICDYITSKRLIAAQQLIAGGNPAGEASRACGFSDYSSFFRLYKKRFGTPPSQKHRG